VGAPSVRVEGGEAAYRLHDTASHASEELFRRFDDPPAGIPSQIASLEDFQGILRQVDLHHCPTARTAPIQPCCPPIMPKVPTRVTATVAMVPIVQFGNFYARHSEHTCMPPLPTPEIRAWGSIKMIRMSPVFSQGESIGRRPCLTLATSCARRGAFLYKRRKATWRGLHCRVT
jgi:hypothetical protein